MIEDDVWIWEATEKDAARLFFYVRNRLTELNIQPEEFRIQTLADEVAEIENFRRAPNSVFLFAVDKNANAWSDPVLGTVTLTGNGMRHAEKRSAVEHIAQLGLSVHPDVRGKGLGGLLLDTAIGRARRDGVIKRIEITSYADNPRARKFFIKHGFEIEGISKKAILKEGSFIDAYRLAYVM